MMMQDNYLLIISEVNMELLPKDVLFIVYRYIFDHNYTQLKQQYSIEWIVMWNPNHKGFWNGVGVANWRNLDGIKQGINNNGIYKFDNPFIPISALLPINYV